MKATLKIVPIIVFLIACSTEVKNMNVHRAYLTNGTFYLNVKRSNDTLRFQSEIYDKGNWNNTIWEITNDSIFQECRKSYLDGKDRRKYALSNDTLTIWTNLKEIDKKPRRSGKELIEYYLVLKSAKNELELVDLNNYMMIDFLTRINSDIQLR